MTELPEESRQQLREARERVPAFNSAASAGESELMDNLILAHAAYVVTVRFSREGRPAMLLQQVEKDVVQRGATFYLFQGGRSGVRSLPEQRSNNTTNNPSGAFRRI